MIGGDYAQSFDSGLVPGGSDFPAITISTAAHGFACYDTTAKAFFGPTGVLERERRQGIGTALLLVTLRAMAAEGYAYGIIGGVGPADFYAKAVGAVPIASSTPGIYANLLRGGRGPGQKA